MKRIARLDHNYLRAVALRWLMKNVDGMISEGLLLATVWDYDASLSDNIGGSLGC